MSLRRGRGGGGKKNGGAARDARGVGVFPVEMRDDPCSPSVGRAWAPSWEGGPLASCSGSWSRHLCALVRGLGEDFPVGLSRRCGATEDEHVSD